MEETLIKNRKLKFLTTIVEYAKFIIIGLLIAFLLKSCVMVNAHIPSESMENTIMTNSNVIASRLSYIFSDPKQGDVIIFQFPDNEEELYVKRIIGVPGDSVYINNGCVFVNGEQLKEDYIAEETIGTFGPYIVPKDSYFVMGDNRNHSNDARYWKNTFVKKDKIEGKAKFVYYPEFKILE